MQRYIRPVLSIPKIFRELDEKPLAGGLFIHFVCGLLIGKFIFLAAKASLGRPVLSPGSAGKASG